MNSSLLIGIVLGAPYLLFELWLFIKPALHETERKSATGFTGYAVLLFVVGILFGYYRAANTGNAAHAGALSKRHGPGRVLDGGNPYLSRNRSV